MAKGAYIGVPNYEIVAEGVLEYWGEDVWDCTIDLPLLDDTFVCNVEIGDLFFPNIEIDTDSYGYGSWMYSDPNAETFSLSWADGYDLEITDYGIGLDTSINYTIRISTGNKNGVARKVKKGYIGVPTLQGVGNLPVGSTVKMNVGGVATDFIVVQQGNPDSAMYDASCDGTWLLTKGCFERRRWSGTNNDYKNSEIHSYLNGEFIGSFDAAVQSAIKQVKIPYQNGTGSGGAIASGTNGLSTKVFLLGAYEVGYTTSADTNIPVDSVCLDYFKEATNSTRVALLDGAAADWWLRSAMTNGTNSVYQVNTNGSIAGPFASSSYAFRPALIIPKNLAVVNGIIDGTEAGYKDVAHKIKKAYIGVPAHSESIGDLSIGSTVKLNVGDKATDFLVVHHGNPDSALYDGSCYGTWLLMRDIYDNTKWHNSVYYQYDKSDINAYLNGDFFSLFDSDVCSAIKQVKIPYEGIINGARDVAIGSNGLSVKVFLLSAHELGWTVADHQYMSKDGSKLDYFISGTGSEANAVRAATKNGVSTDWWTRSPSSYNIGPIYTVRSTVNGTPGSMGTTNSHGAEIGVRPAIIVPSNLSVTNGMVDGSEYVEGVIKGVAKLCWKAQPDTVTFTVYQNKTDAFTFTMPSDMTFGDAISAGYTTGYNANGDAMTLLNTNANGYLMREIRYVNGSIRSSGSVYTDTSRATRAYITDIPIEGNFYDSSGGTVAT